MGARNESGVKSRKRNGKRVLVIDFSYTDKQGRERRYRRDAQLQSRAGAKAEAARLIARAVTTGSLETEQKPMTFAAFVVEHFERVYLPTHTRPGTRERYRALLHRQGILDFFGPKRLDEIDSGDFHGYAAKLAERHVQVRPHWSLVRTVLRAAVEFKVLARLPDDLPKLPRASKKLPKAPLVSEVVGVLAAAQGWLRTAIELGIHAGLRSGEIRAIEVRDVDLARRQIFVRRAYSAKEVLTPKDDEERTVPILPALADELRPLVEGRKPNDRLVLTRRGTTPSRQALLTALTRLLKRLRVPHHSVHGLRHGIFSELVRRGASIEAVRVIAGHSDVKTTMRYVHATAGDVRATMALLAGNQTETAA